MPSNLTPATGNMHTTASKTCSRWFLYHRRSLSLLSFWKMSHTPLGNCYKCLFRCFLYWWYVEAGCATITVLLLKKKYRGSPSEDSKSKSDEKRVRRPNRPKTYKVAIHYATRIPMKAIADELNGKSSEHFGKSSEHFQEAVRVLNIILRHHAAKQ